MRVSIDGRRETGVSDAVQTRHFDFYFDRRGGATLPHDLAADYVWIPRILPAARRLRTDAGWTDPYDGKQSVIFGRAGLPSIRRVASWPPQPRQGSFQARSEATPAHRCD